MGAVAVVQPASATTPRTLIGARQVVVVKLNHNSFALDLYTDRLIAQGYAVLNMATYTAALEAARRYHPAVIIVHDDPDDQIDAAHWIEIQHNDRVAALAVTPLIVLASPARAAELRPNELPDRVIILRNRADTLNQLTRKVQQLLHIWGLDANAAQVWPL